MFGCFIIDNTYSSCLMRYRLFPDKFYRLICLTAYVTPPLVASKTVEYDPLPMGRNNKYGPTLRHFLCSFSFSILIIIILNLFFALGKLELAF